MASYLKHIPQVAGVELSLAGEHTLTANLVVVKRVRAKVHFVNGEYGLTDFNAIKGHVPNGVPVALTISGKGIIHRTTTNGPSSDNDADLLRHVLPNAKPDDFYLQQTPLEGGKMLSVARRKLVDDILAQIDTQGLVLLSVGLGPFAVDLFKDYLCNADMESLTLGRHRFALQQGVFTGYDFLPQEATPWAKRVDIANEQLNERLVPAFATAFQTISDLSFAQLPIARTLAKSVDYRQQLAFKRSGIALMALFLLLLLGNALSFMHYTEKVADFAGSDALTIQREIDALRQQTAAREELLGGLWHAETPRWGMAYMADRIADSLPEGIMLDELAVYPRDEAMSRRQRRPVHTPSAMRIKGTCKDMPLLNGWIKQVRMLAFCQAVEIEEYGFDGRGGVGAFTLYLTLEP
ncbi:hypothetical protein [Parapedobacter tibetensis]|uniref:hypothetical protein n=1 Tax=Parapedobacter tibetensis TaxID=2972951 RepID=UPI00214D4993|nr:hypothetical protein [Parapedobacter tibetensis]